MTAAVDAAGETDVLVLGGGMAGAMAALSARAAGARVVLVRRALGATALSSGAVSVAPDPSALPNDPLSAHQGPIEAARRLAALRPDHPYAVVGVERLAEALAFAAGELSRILAPPIDRARFLATPLGGAAAVALCQRSMVDGDLLLARGPVAVAGIPGHVAFDPELVAAGLSRYAGRGGPEVQVARFGLPPFADGAARPVEIARALEASGRAEALGEALRAALPAGTGAVLLPPVLGLDPAARVPERIAASAGVPVAETLSDVPSLPGLRLQRTLDEQLRARGIEIRVGPVAGVRGPGEAVEVAGRPIRAGSWVLATGRYVGGGIVRRGILVEPVLGIPVQAAEGRESGVHLAGRPAASLTFRDRRARQPLLSAGVRVDASLRPVDERGLPVRSGLFAAGAVVGGHEQATDGTGLGVAILTGFLAGSAAARAT